MAARPWDGSTPLIATEPRRPRARGSSRSPPWPAPLPAIIVALALLPPEVPAAITLVQHRGLSDPEQLIEIHFVQPDADLSERGGGARMVASGAVKPPTVRPSRSL